MREQLDFEGSVFDIRMILDWKDIIAGTSMLFPIPSSLMGDLFGEVSKDDQDVLIALYKYKWIRVQMNTFYTRHLPTSF